MRKLYIKPHYRRRKKEGLVEYMRRYLSFDESPATYHFPECHEEDLHCRVSKNRSISDIKAIFQGFNNREIKTETIIRALLTALNGQKRGCILYCPDVKKLVLARKATREADGKYMFHKNIFWDYQYYLTQALGLLKEPPAGYRIEDANIIFADNITLERVLNHMNPKKVQKAIDTRIKDIKKKPSRFFKYDDDWIMENDVTYSKDLTNRKRMIERAEMFKAKIRKQTISSTIRSSEIFELDDTL